MNARLSRRFHKVERQNAALIGFATEPLRRRFFGWLKWLVFGK